MAGAGPADNEAKLGKGVSLKKATPIEALTTKPKEFVGKTVRVDGVAKAVCAMMGCWMAVAVDETDPASPTVRLKVEDGVIVFPMSAKGKKVSAEGVFELVRPTTWKHGKRPASTRRRIRTRRLSTRSRPRERSSSSACGSREDSESSSAAARASERGAPRAVKKERKRAAGGSFPRAAASPAPPRPRGPAAADRAARSRRTRTPR